MIARNGEKYKEAARKTAPPSSEGQGEGRPGPPAGVGQLQRPAVAAGGLAGEGETHAHVALPGPAGVAGVKAPPRPGQGLGGEAGAGVLHGHGEYGPV